MTEPSSDAVVDGGRRSLRQFSHALRLDPQGFWLLALASAMLPISQVGHGLLDGYRIVAQALRLAASCASATHLSCDRLVTDSLSAVEALVYGLIQGVTEFLPVSSSGHLALAHRLGLGALPPDAELPFDVLLHGATLVAITIAFRKDILAALKGPARLWLCFALSVFPAALVGAFGLKYIAAAADSLWVLGGFYLVSAVLLSVAERISLHHTRTKHGSIQPTNTTPAQPTRHGSPSLSPPTTSTSVYLTEVTRRQALAVGLIQTLALFPGVSRSGSAIAAGLMSGMKPALAVSYSFLVGISLIAGAAVKDTLDGGFTRLFASVSPAPLAIAFLAALGSGLASIHALRLVVGKRRLIWFGGYCALIACGCFALASA